MVVQSDFYIVKNAQLLEQTNVLEGTRDSILIDLDRTASGDILSIEKNGTGCAIGLTPHSLIAAAKIEQFIPHLQIFYQLFLEKIDYTHSTN